MKQRTKEWFEARIGMFSASQIGLLLGKGRGKDKIFSDSANSYILEKLCERMTGETKKITGPALDWGTELEPIALDWYKAKTGNIVDEVGFVTIPTYKNYAGGSPDGLVGDDGIIEIKCPFNSVNHLITLINKEIPKKNYNMYYSQIQFNLLMTGRKWCDFVSYDPRFNPSTKISIIRILRDDDFIQQLEERLVLAEIELNKLYEKIENEE